MFSEYASRFLAQSQSVIRPTDNNAPRNPLERQRRQDQAGSRLGRLGAAGAGGARGGGAAPGAGSQFSPFAFGSRTAAQAPLFYSASANEFREEDDEQEHEREVADFYALQRSRRQFVHSRLDDSSEPDEYASRSEEGDSGVIERRSTAQGGIRSSWTGDKGKGRAGRRAGTALRDVDEGLSDDDDDDGSSSSSASARLYDVGLESTIRHRDDELADEPPGDLTVEVQDDDELDPPSVQQFRSKLPRRGGSPPGLSHADPAPLASITESAFSSAPAGVASEAAEPPRHDAFWGTLYVLAMIGMFASFFLVWLHTSAPGPGKPLKDTIYSTMHASYFMLAMDTLVACIVALLWLALLRHYVRPLVYTILIAVPVLLFSFTLYPFVSSFQHPQEERGWFQDLMMRWFSLLPAALGALWVYGVYKGRRSFGKAIGILEFACKVLTANPPLLLVGFGTLGVVVVWTWLWMGMFTRIFLGGHTATGALYFVIDVGSWWLGAYFVLMYLWTLGVAAGIQRATTAATVSQWYFHRLSVPAPAPATVVAAAANHAATTLFGTVCLSTLLTLVARLPVLVLPKRLMALVGFCSYTLLPNSVLILTHPTTLTYASVHSKPLAAAAHAVSQLAFMNPRGRFRNRDRATPRTSSILPYNLALLLLHSTRLVASMAFGFGAWVSTARKLDLDGVRWTGSIYAYVVGLIAGAIGWAVLGAMEGVLTGIVDAVVICWASELRNGDVKYCREADYLLGDGDADLDVEEAERFLR